ncbi:MAG: hypothetical protein RLZ12_705 [Bacillota bacterium]|jgi:subtilisin family serine protease
MALVDTFTFLYRSKPCKKDFQDIGCPVLHTGSYAHTITAKVTEEKLAIIKKDPALLSAEPDCALMLAQYNIEKYLPAKKIVHIGAKQILPWNIERVLQGAPLGSGQGIKIGIIDTGIDYAHPDLAGNIKGGINLLNSKKRPLDDNGHGTHIAGIIAAINNNIGVVGVASSASLYAIKVLDSKGAGSLINLIKGIEWAIAKKIQILNISISGGQLVSRALNKTIQAADERGIVIVAAAGNTGSPTGRGDTVQIPARIKPVIAVAALNNQNKRDKYSATGTTIDLAAPGTKILSTYHKKRYAYLSGTSMAAAHVSGVLAIYKKKFPNSSPSRLCSTAKRRARPLGNVGNSHTGWGIISAR